MERWLLLASLLCAPVLGQEAYTWTDENGQVHYSDRPHPGAAVIELRAAQGYSSAAPAIPAGSPEAGAPPPAPVERYTAFNIVAPAQQATLWNIGTVLDVQVELSPRLQEGHHLGAYLDGALVDVGATATQFQLPEVYRGMHTLQAVVLDANGQELLRSAAVSFMVQQTSILNPNRP